MKRKFTAALTALLMMSSYSYAAEFVNCEISSDGIITLKNSLDSQKEGSVVSMLVYRPGVTAENLSEETDNVSNIAENNQTLSGADGVYEFKFAIDGQSGFYDVKIGSDDGDEQNFQILYSNPAEAKVLLADLNSVTGADEFYEIIYGTGQGWKSLGFYLALSDTADDRKISDLLYKHVTLGNKFDENDTLKAAETFKKFKCIELLNEEKRISADDYENYLKVKEEEFYKYYSKEYITNEVKENIFESLKGKDFKTEEEYKNALLQEVILKTVEYSDGFGNIRDILTEYQNKTGINTNSLTVTNYNNVSGKKYSDYVQLKQGLEKSVQYQQNGGSGGGKGSGGSKNVLGSNGIFIDKDLVNQPISNPTYFEDEIFTDINHVSWAKDAIETLYKKGIITGKGEKKFCPDESISREEFVTLIVKAMKAENTDAEIGFSDVAEDAWYYPYIKAAVSKGIILGKEDGSFGVGEKVTRQDMAVMLCRALMLENENTDYVFADDDNISEYAKTAVYAMKAKNVISGFEDGTFKPLDSATRAQAAVMIQKAFN